jgi:hypothetical protein
MRIKPMGIDSKQIKGLTNQTLQFSQCTEQKCKDQTGGIGQGEKKIGLQSKRERRSGRARQENGKKKQLYGSQ